MSLLRNDNVLWYHPLDSDTEYTQSFDWTRSANGIFDTGIVVSGFTQNSDTTVDIKGGKAAGGYDDLENYDHFTVAFWSSGLYGGVVKDDYIYIGFGSTSVDDGNGVRYRMSESSNAPFVRLIKRGSTGPAKQVSSFPSIEGWHLTVIDFSLQGSIWQYLVSINGSGWQNVGSGGSADLPDTDVNCIIELKLESTSYNIILDEVIIWAGHDVFTESELSNLYELVNTYDSPMNLYGSVFGTTISSGINCFTHGCIQTSGDISLYIPSQKETKSTDLLINGHIPIYEDISFYISGIPPVASSSITLYIVAPSPASSDLDLYIVGPLFESNSINIFTQGHQILSDNVDQYIYGYLPIFDNIDLYISGVPWKSSAINLYTVGPLPVNGNIDDFIWGHAIASSGGSLFVKGAFPTIDAFVSTVRNNPSNSVDLFIHSVASGMDTIFYTNNSATFFINDSGDIPTVNSSWPSFIRVDDAITTGESGTWSAFAKGGNTANDNINMYTYGHAYGEYPHGTSIINSRTLFINGLSLRDGDEGLLDNGYYTINKETPAFAKVHFGLNNSVSMYISGSILTVPPIASTDLFIFGILDTEFGSFTTYTLGLASTSGQTNLFLFGIQDIISSGIPLYIEVTDIGSSNKIRNLYTHGF